LTSFDLLFVVVVGVYTGKQFALDIMMLRGG